MPSRTERRAAQEAALPYFDTLVLYGSCDVDPGASIAPNTAALANPHGLAMQIYEIIFRVYPKNTAADQFVFITGMSMGVKFDMGEIAVSDQLVPLDGYGNARDDADVIVPQISIFPDPSDDDVRATPFGYRWRLKYPLLVPAGAVLTPTFAHLGQNPFPAVVDVVYLARTLPPTYQPPAQVMMPWVSSYYSKSYDDVVDTAAGRELSPELDIVNNFNVPLEISRLTGRLSSTIQQFVYSSPIATSNPTQAAIEWGGDHRYRLMTMRIRGSRGDEIARVKTPFNGLFPISWRSWDIPGSWIMRPGEFYKMQLAVDAVDYTPRTQDVGRVQLAMTAVGYRKMDTSIVGSAALKPVPEAA